MNKTKALLFLGMLTGLSLTLNAGGRSSSSSDDQDREIPYTTLSPDAGLFRGVIIENGHEVAVSKISFSGDTVVSGIRKEHESSSNRISLADFSELEVIDPVYQSDRYPHREFALVRGTLARQGTHEDFLFPRELIVCAESTSLIEKSWYLRSLDRIIIKQGLLDDDLLPDAHYEMPEEIDPTYNMDL